MFNDAFTTSTAHSNSEWDIFYRNPKKRSRVSGPVPYRWSERDRLHWSPPALSHRINGLLGNGNVNTRDILCWLPSKSRYRRLIQDYNVMSGLIKKVTTYKSPAIFHAFVEWKGRVYLVWARNICKINCIISLGCVLKMIRLIMIIFKCRNICVYVFKYSKTVKLTNGGKLCAEMPFSRIFLLEASLYVSMVIMLFNLST